jgi:hypothetical protein
MSKSKILNRSIYVIEFFTLMQYYYIFKKKIIIMTIWYFFFLMTLVETSYYKLRYLELWFGFVLFCFVFAAASVKHGSHLSTAFCQHFTLRTYYYTVWKQKQMFFLSSCHGATQFQLYFDKKMFCRVVSRIPIKVQRCFCSFFGQHCNQSQKW